MKDGSSLNRRPAGAVVQVKTGGASGGGPREVDYPTSDQLTVRPYAQVAYVKNKRCHVTKHVLGGAVAALCALSICVKGAVQVN